jgi:hypothetical protein
MILALERSEELMTWPHAVDRGRPHAEALRPSRLTGLPVRKRVANGASIESEPRSAQPRRDPLREVAYEHRLTARPVNLSDSMEGEA